MSNILASSISHKEHLAAFDEMVAARFAALEIEALLVYLVDTCDAKLLPFLGAQFGVMGLRGWALTTTEAQRRALIKNAITLRKYEGTPFAVKEAIKSVGYYNAIIEEGVAGVGVMYYDGVHRYDGSEAYGGSYWANFRVIIDLGEEVGLTEESQALLVALINQWKNVRSILLDISFISTVIDIIRLEDEFTLDIITTPT